MSVSFRLHDTERRELLMCTSFFEQDTSCLIYRSGKQRFSVVLMQIRGCYWTVAASLIRRSEPLDTTRYRSCVMLIGHWKCSRALLFHVVVPVGLVVRTMLWHVHGVIFMSCFLSTASTNISVFDHKLKSVQMPTKVFLFVCLFFYSKRETNCLPLKYGWT